MVMYCPVVCIESELVSAAEAGPKWPKNSKKEEISSFEAPVYGPL